MTFNIQTESALPLLFAYPDELEFEVLRHFVRFAHPVGNGYTYQTRVIATDKADRPHLRLFRHKFHGLNRQT
jgi:acyl dehydratase